MATGDERHRVESMLDAMAPEAARRVLESYVGWTADEVDEDLAGAIKLAIEKLPVEGRIRGQQAKTIVKGLTLLVPEVPEEHPERRALRRAVDELRERV